MPPPNINPVRPLYLTIAAWVLIAANCIVFLLDFELVMAALGGGIAWWALVGGLLVGISLAGLVQPRRRRYWPRDGDTGIAGLAPSGRV
jgi:membrane associated rhomboid family serine protease